MEWVLKFFENLFYSFANATSWLTTDLVIGSWSVSPLTLLTFGGLTTFLLIAIGKWILS